MAGSRYWFATRVAVPYWIWRMTPRRIRERITSWGYE